MLADLPAMLCCAKGSCLMLLRMLRGISFMSLSVELAEQFHKNINDPTLEAAKELAKSDS